MAMKLKTFIFLIIAFLVLELTACFEPAEKTFDTELAEKLQTALQDAVENSKHQFPGALLGSGAAECEPRQPRQPDTVSLAF